MLALFGAGAAPPARAATLTTVGGIAWDPTREAYVIRTSAPLTPRVLQLDHPPRIVIDLPDTRLLPVQLTVSGAPTLGVSRLRAGQVTASTTRVVLDLLKPVQPRVMSLDRELLVGLGKGPLAPAAEARQPATIRGIRHSNGSLFVLMDPPRNYWTHVITSGPSRTRLRLVFPDSRLGPGVFGSVPIGANGLERLTASQLGPNARIDIDMTRPPIFDIVQRPNGWYLKAEPRGSAVPALPRRPAEGTLQAAEAPPAAPDAQVPEANPPAVPEAPLTLRKVGSAWQLQLATERPVSWRITPAGDDRLHVDLQGAHVPLPRDSVYIDNGLIARVRASRRQGDSTRLTIDLDQPVRHVAAARPGRQGLVLTLSRLGKMRVTLDPGHGGTDSGTSGRAGTREKDVTLQIATRLARTMESNGLSVQMTRMRDLEILLRPRVEMANRNDSDVYVSIHANSFGEQRGIKGIETYYFSDESFPLARAIHRSLVQTLGQPDRGIRKNNFYVVHHTRMPAALVEIGYLSNPEEEKLLTDPAYQERAAQAIYEGVRQFLGTRKAGRH